MTSFDYLAVFYESKTKATNFQIMLNMFYVCLMYMFCIVFQVVQMFIICTCVRVELVKGVNTGDPVQLTGL